MNEQNKYDLIKNLVEKKGNKRVLNIKLNCSLRTVDCLINKFKTKEKDGFVHGNRNSKPSNTYKWKYKRNYYSNL